MLILTLLIFDLFALWPSEHLRLVCNASCVHFSSHPPRRTDSYSSICSYAIFCHRWGEEESTADFCGVFREWEAGRSTQDTETEKGVSNERVAEINGQRQNVSRGECGTPPGTSALTPLSHFDFLLAGDVLYKHSLLEPFLRTVGDMLAPDGRVFLCHVPRAGVTYDTVEEAFVEAGFRFEVLKGVNSEEREGPNVEKNTLNGVDDTCSDGSAAVGGVELCVDDARRARLYEFWLNR